MCQAMRDGCCNKNETRLRWRREEVINFVKKPTANEKPADCNERKHTDNNEEPRAANNK